MTGETPRDDDPETGTDDIYEETAEDESPEIEILPPEQRRGSWGLRKRGTSPLTVIVLAGLAAVIGTIGGTYGTKIILDRQAGAQTGVQSEVDGISDAISAVQARLNRLEAAQNTLKSDLSNISGAADLSDIRSRLRAVETRPAGNGDRAGTASGAIDPDILARLDALEADLAAMEIPGEEGQSAERPSLPPPELASLRRRVAALEQDVSALRSQPARPVTSLPPFPSEPLISALAEARAASNSTSWFDRALSKHITVRDETSRETVQRIETRLENGDLTGALDIIDSLPEPARLAISDWLDAARSQTALERTRP